MPNDEYTAVPLSEDEEAPSVDRTPHEHQSHLKLALFLIFFGAAFFVAGFGVGQNWSGSDISMSWSLVGEEILLPQQAFIPEMPTKEVKFRFPTEYEDTGIDGDKLWNELMPLGAGFIRVPHPRRFDMPESTLILEDKDGAELYSLSVTHQLHCLGVLRDVIVKYDKKSKSRFAGDGHEYHCLDYIRQAILCSGDTTLDYADDILRFPNGTISRAGFTGANSTHVCRDWDAIKAFAVENRSGNKTGIF